jgi:hypothetical protein
VKCNCFDETKSKRLLCCTEILPIQPIVHCGYASCPVIYGMTIGEYARMINGRGLASGELKCDLTVIKCKNYDHQTLYELPVKPSPNLPNMTAVYLYPSLCFFEVQIFRWEGELLFLSRFTDLLCCLMKDSALLPKAFRHQ